MIPVTGIELAIGAAALVVLAIAFPKVMETDTVVKSVNSYK